MIKQDFLICMSINFIIFYILCFASNFTNAREIINLATFESCPYICTNGKEKGFLVDIVESIFDEVNIEVMTKALPAKRALKLARKGSFHGIIGIQQRQAPELTFPTESIGQYRYLMYVRDDDNWLFTGLNSLYERKIGVQLGVSYGVADSFIQRYGYRDEIVKILSGNNIPLRMIKMLKTGRINMFLADKNVIDSLSGKTRIINLNVAGTIPPDNIYVAFNHHKAQQYSDFISNGITKLRENGYLNSILARYNLSDWKNWRPDYRDPFAGDYINDLEKKYSNPKKAKTNQALITFKSSVNTDYGYWKYAVKFKELLEQYSNGKLRVELRFGDSSEHDIVMDIAEGNTQMGMVAINNFTPFAPSIGFFSLPYMFPTKDSAKKIIRHKKMEEIALRSALESNVRPLSFFIGGYRLLANSERPIKRSADLRGLKIRVPQNQFMVETFRSWGIEPYPLPWPEVYPALEAKLINGQENPMNIMFSGIKKDREVWEILKYVTNIRYFLFTAPHLISENFYQSLTKESKIFVKKAAMEAEEYIWDIMSKEEQQLIDLAKSKGMIFISPENETGDWEFKAKEIWSKFYFRAGGEELVNSVNRIINQE
ncbi:TRAP transporter substrate-binding protein DctP [Zooshikella ganghwensis]|uniref:TRAP transporter substrate-binding protein DctP n=1 Tax=Zooshikella ganghwensis TaxID=202772 RepID=UPI0003F95F18|nr:TRAP transporter substrate-binding protein DctP [Zooshikella ganghwensis]